MALVLGVLGHVLEGLASIVCRQILQTQMLSIQRQEHNTEGKQPPAQRLQQSPGST